MAIDTSRWCRSRELMRAATPATAAAMTRLVRKPLMKRPEPTSAPKTVAGRAVMFADPSRALTPAVIIGGPGVLVTVEGRVVSFMAFTVIDDRITAIDTLGDRERLATLEIAGFDR